MLMNLLNPIACRSPIRSLSILVGTSPKSVLIILYTSPSLCLLLTIKLKLSLNVIFDVVRFFVPTYPVTCPQIPPLVISHSIFSFSMTNLDRCKQGGFPYTIFHGYADF